MGDTKMSVPEWVANLSHENGQENTLYIHPISGNAIACALFARDNGIDIKIHFIDIMAGEQMAPWFLEINPMHTIPSMMTPEGLGMFETGAILRNLARRAGQEVTDWDNMAMDWRQAEFYKHAAGIYGPSLGFGEGDLAEGVKNFIEKAEPILLHFLKDRKFVGGETPSIADYMLVPVLTMFGASSYAQEGNERVRSYIEDFAAASSSYEELMAMQLGYVASKCA